MNTIFYQHWREVPEGAWRWPNFSPAEIACRGTGKLLINKPALDKLQALRDRLGKPLIVRSAYRSPEHNRAAGGATRSKHMNGLAFDIAMSNHGPVAFEAAARDVGFLGFIWVVHHDVDEDRHQKSKNFCAVPNLRPVHYAVPGRTSVDELISQDVQSVEGEAQDACGVPDLEGLREGADWTGKPLIALPRWATLRTNGRPLGA